MKKLFLATASLLSISSILCGAVQADLGTAEEGFENINNASERIYEAYCGSVENRKCEVKFREGRMIVNGSSGISADQVTKIRQQYLLFFDKRKTKQQQSDHGGTCLIGGTIHALERPSCQNHIYIQYEDTAGKKRKGLFRFQHKASGNAFLIDIELWSGMELRERGPSIKIVE